MRGTYEAYILVEIKDGTQFVCALNRQKNKRLPVSDEEQAEEDRRMEDLEAMLRSVIWN